MRKSIILLLLLLPITYSFSFGTVPKNSHRVINQGESGYFEILFWNMGKDEYRVDIELDQFPEGWQVITRPQNFILEPTPVASPPYGEGEYMKIEGIGYVKADVMRIFIKIPVGTVPGNYDIVLTAKAGDPEKEISFFQTRRFELTVEVEEAKGIFEEDNSKESEDTQNPEPSDSFLPNSKIVEKTQESLIAVRDTVSDQADKVKKSITGMFAFPSFNLFPLFLALLFIILTITILLWGKIG
jgi:hypothetical protein